MMKNLIIILSAVFLLQRMSEAQEAGDASIIASSGDTAVVIAGEGSDASDEFSKYTAVVSAGTLNVRARPAIYFEVISKLDKDAEVVVVSEKGEWSEIVAPADSNAWIAERYVNDDGVVNGDGVRVRAGAGLAYTSYSIADRGDIVQLLGESKNGWRKIGIPENSTAWVHSKFLEKSVEEKSVVEADEDEGGVEEIAEAEVVVEPEKEEEKAEEEAELAVVETKAEDLNGNDTVEGDVVKVEPEENAQVVEEKEEMESVEEKTVVEKEEEPETLEEEAPAEEEMVAEKEEAEDDAVAEQDNPEENDEDQVAEDEIEEAPMEEVAVEEEVKPVGPPVPTGRAGIVVSLGEKASPYATHILAEQIKGVNYPVCYLRSNRINLKEWELGKAAVYGREIWYPNWKRPVVEVTGIVVDR